MRTVTYELDANSLEHAQEIWDDDGPEVGEAGFIQVVASSKLERAPRTRTAAIAQLRVEGFDAVADDLEDGIAPDRVLRNLGEIGEQGSLAYTIVSEIDTDA